MSDELEPLLAALRALPKRARRGTALLAADAFRRAVELLDERSDEALLELARGKDRLAARAALEALARRDGPPETADALLAMATDVRPQTAIFLLRALDRRVPEGLVGRLLSMAGPAWLRAPFEDLRALVRRRDEPVVLRDVDDERLNPLGDLVRRLGDALAPSVADAVADLKWERDTAQALGAVGRVWRPARAAELAAGALEDDGFRRDVETIAAGMRAKPLLVVGEQGTGRTTRLRAAAAQLCAQGWIVFEAGPAEVNAGMTYIGELEGRMRHLAGLLDGRRIVWIVPEFEALLWAGTHRHSATGALDLLLQSVEGRSLHLAGETDPGGLERLLRARPAVRDAFEPVRVEPASEPRAVALALRWAARENVAAEDAVIREALALGRHYLGGGALPGSLLTLLEAARRHARGGPIELPQVLAAVAERSGLPPAMLDERERLDVDALRRWFSARVIGQPEAVECVVDRVALLKAGLTDPTRPQAVLLFVGPTGTGKTEIAKALAEHLFGSPERMIRLDLSEYQTPGSARRVLGDGEPEDPSLVGAIRRQPFSVVLLDEFEKADPGVWDLFLQVFDDGRLSDPRGATADFRHAVIVMTSNLGATIPTGTGVGFSPASGFAAGSVEQAVSRAFRREFVNRLDRVVVFRPLSRPVMRELLRGELDAVLSRRGLRSRAWAVEWDDSAIEFLLAEGFTPDLGARPLKRAVERHFLTPLALAIAAHDYPQGDQFLFVRAAAGGGLDVTFVDPDAPEAEPAPAPPAAAPSLRTLAREGGGPVGALEAAYDDVRARVEDEAWQAEKAALLGRLAEPGFWDGDERTAVLGAVEVRDRIEAGLRTAGSLLGRLGGARRPPSALVRRAAQRLLLLGEALDALEAGEPADALLRVDAVGDGVEFAGRIAAMYRAWARERGMRMEALEERATSRSFRLLACVGGFAALRSLAPEAGLHVLELPDGHGGFRRVRVRVAVAPDVPGGPPPAEALAAAASGRARIVRRYRERPAPLVRDAVRGWRTGRVDMVLAGGFDLVE